MELRLLGGPAEPSKIAPYALVVALGAVGYFAAAELGLELATINKLASPVWPASGLAIALIRRFGIRMWPAVALGALAANTVSGSIVTALPITIGNTIEAVAGGMILLRLAALQSERFILANTAGYVLAAFFATMASASIGVGALWFAGTLTNHLVQPVWLTWWTGDALGVLTAAPALLTPRPLLHERDPALSSPAKLGIILLGAILALAAPALVPGADAAVYLALLAVLLAARWFGPQGAAYTVLLFAIGLVAEAAAGAGPFLGGSLNQSLINTQIFLATLAVVGLALGDLHRLNLSLTSLVFGVTVAISAGAFIGENHHNAESASERLTVLTQNATGRIEERISAYARALRTASGLFAASGEVERSEWRSFVDTMSLHDQFPGLVGVGVITPVTTKDLEPFIAAQHADGMPDFALKAVPGARSSDAPGDQHFVITFLEPQDANVKAIGLDIASEAGRRNAAIEARDSGQPVLTPRITLVQDPSHRSGFLLLVPFYRTSEVPATPQERAGSFRGWVYAPLIAEEFVNSVMHDFDGEIAPEIFDGAPTSADARLIAPATDKASAYQVFSEVPLKLINRNLTLRWWANNNLLRSGLRDSLLLSCGIIIVGAMLATMIATIQSMRDKALALASEMTSALAKTSESLSATEQRFRAAVNVMEDGFGLFDADDRIILHNDAFIDEGTRQEFGDDVLGRTFEEILRAFAYRDMPVSETFDREKWIADRLERHRNPTAASFEVKWGGERWMRISERRTPDGGYVGIWTDISKLKQAEARLRDAIDSVGEGFALFDAEHRFVIVNQRFVDLYPASGAFATSGTAFEEFLRIGVAQGEYPGLDTAEDIDGFVGGWRDTFNRRVGRTGERRLGDGRWTLFRHEPIPSGGFVRLCTDITAQKKREADLEQAKRALEAQAIDLVSLAAKLDQARQVAETANDEKSAFLAMMSHEIRTPMNGVLGLNNLLLATELTGEQRKLASAVNQSAETLLVIINDILDFSKLEAGKVTVEPVNFDLRHLIDTVLAVFRPRAEAKGLALNLAIDAGCPEWVVSDSSRLQQILYNLLGNAQKFTEQGAIDLAVTHEALDDGNLRLRFEVRDSGIGISAEAQKKLFTRFTQADNSITRRFGGTGLGLAISKQLTELLGGAIGVESTPGIGSCFWFTIVCGRGVPEAIAGQEAPSTHAAPTTGRPLKILVAEDNHINQMVILGILKQMGHHADAVGNGLEAIEAHRQKAYDLILMDAQMPEMDGKTAAARIRSLPDGKSGIPIIALTANAMDTHRDEYLAVGMNDFVAKPVRVNELTAAIRRSVPADLLPAADAKIADASPDSADDADFGSDDAEFDDLMATIRRAAN